jgi:hypothetical protein
MLLSALDCWEDEIERNTDAWIAIGTMLAKSASDQKVSYNLTGMLQLTGNTDYLIMSMPNALVRGVFSAIDAPGIELPPGPGADSEFSASVVVMTPDEVATVGRDEITERGKRYAYTLGRFLSLEPEDWPGVDRVWMIRIHSPELQELRRSYGLSAFPKNGESDFYCTVAIRRRGVLGDNAKSKAESGTSA